MLGNLGSAEILIIAIVILVFFGSNKLNELARGLGESTKEYKRIKKEFNSALNEDYDEPDEKEEKKPKKKKKKSKITKE